MSSLGFGVGPFGTGPLGTALLPPEDETHAPLHTSRKIDGVTKRYVVDTDGGYEGMSDTAQRVYLAVAFADIETPFITERDNATMAARIRARLAGMSTGKKAVIKIESITVTSDAAGVSKKIIVFRDLVNYTTQTVEAT